MHFVNITLPHVLIFSTFLFTLGVMGLFVNRKNIMIALMCLELMLLAVNINFVAVSSFMGDVFGQVMTFFILTVAAAEVAIGLAILTLFYRSHKTVNLDAASSLKH